jgi:serine/threonine protein phosphatase PrpC
LCSDGLSDIVTEDAIADVMRSAKQPRRARSAWCSSRCRPVRPTTSRSWWPI